MYSVEIPTLRKNHVAVVLHHPAAAGAFEAFAEVAVVSSSDGWLDRAEAKFGNGIRLYADGTAYLGARGPEGTWEKFTARQLADDLERVRVAPVQ